MWSTGIRKKPWIWPAWRSIVRTRSTPAASRMSASSFAVIGSRGEDFLSWREYGNHGITAVMRLAEASFAPWIMIRSSSRWSFVSFPWQAWTRKTSAPRIDSR